MPKRLLDLIKLELFLVANAFLNFLWRKLEGGKYTLLAFAFLRKQKCVEVFLVLMHTQGKKVIFLDAPYPESWNINTHTVINHSNEGSPEVHMLTLSFTCTHTGSCITHQAYARAPQLEVLFTLLSGVSCYCSLAWGFAEPAWCLTHWARAEGWGV